MDLLVLAFVLMSMFRSHRHKFRLMRPAMSAQLRLHIFRPSAADVCDEAIVAATACVTFVQSNARAMMGSDRRMMLLLFSGQEWFLYLVPIAVRVRYAPDI